MCVGCASVCEERLRDVFGWRGCVIFLTHLLTRLCNSFVERFHIFFGGCMIFVVGRLCFFFGGCMIICVERLRFVDRFHDFLCGEVA